MALAAMLVTSLLGCVGQTEELIGERDGLRVYERGKNDSRFCLASLMKLVELMEAGELPRLKLVLHSEGELVKGMIEHSNYRIVTDKEEYYVSVSRRFMSRAFLLKSDGGSYSAFGVPESSLSTSAPNCSLEESSAD